MKHSLFLLCLAIALACGSHHTAAGLLTEPNPTPTELNSPSFVSDGAYQVAGIYHIVDYSKKMESYFGKRINDDEYNRDKGDCGAYGFLSNCTSPAVGKGVEHPVPGLTCYRECVSCASSGYVDSCPSSQTGTAVAVASGLTCYKNCSCPSEYKYTTESGTGRTLCTSPATVGGGSCTQSIVVYNNVINPTLPKGDTIKNVTFYKSCTCPSEYNLSSAQSDADCTSCTAGGVTKYKCTANCNAYPLTVCPSGCNCSACPSNSGKYKIDGAQEWWQVSGNTCVAKPCPAGYTAGVTSCDSSSTTPNYHKHASAKSGSQVCGYCSCDNTTDCSAYTLTSQSDANANYSSCTTGCGSEKVTKYKMTGCKSGYELKNGKCEKSCGPEYKYTIDNCYVFNVATGTRTAATGSDVCDGKSKQCIEPSVTPYYDVIAGEDVYDKPDKSLCPEGMISYHLDIEDRGIQYTYFENTLDNMLKVNECVCGLYDYEYTEDNGTCTASCTDSSGTYYAGCSDVPEPGILTCEEQMQQWGYILVKNYSELVDALRNGGDGVQIAVAATLDGMHFSTFPYRATIHDAHARYSLCPSGKIRNTTIILGGRLDIDLTLDIPFENLTFDAVANASVTFNSEGKLGYFDFNNGYYGGCHRDNSIKLYINNSNVTSSSIDNFFYGSALANGCGSLEAVPSDRRDEFTKACERNSDNLLCNFN